MSARPALRRRFSAGPRVALVHDWLVGMRGGERVLECLAELFPEAPIHTLVARREALSPLLASRRIVVSPLQRLPAATRGYRWLLPLMPWAVERFDLRGYDLVLSSSHCVAKGARHAPGAVHVSYVHTPMRYAYDQFADYFGGAWPKELAFRLALAPIRAWDRASSRRGQRYIANSRHVAARIARAWGQPATVINPPVELARFSPAPGREVEDYYLLVSALVPYKRVDLALAAFALRPRRRLLVVGDGPQERRLRALAPPNVRFVGAHDGAQLAGLYRRARAFVMPGLEDFGITPLESMASGRPVVAYGQGGVLDSVRPLGQARPTGVFFDQQTPEALAAACDTLERHLGDFEPAALRRHARGFSTGRFKQRVRQAVELALRGA